VRMFIICPLHQMLLDDRMKEKEIKEVYDSYAYFNKATEEHRLLNE